MKFDVKLLSPKLTLLRFQRYFTGPVNNIAFAGLECCENRLAVKFKLTMTPGYVSKEADCFAENQADYFNIHDQLSKPFELVFSVPAGKTLPFFTQPNDLLGHLLFSAVEIKLDEIAADGDQCCSSVKLTNTIVDIKKTLETKIQELRDFYKIKNNEDFVNNHECFVEYLKEYERLLDEYLMDAFVVYDSKLGRLHIIDCNFFTSHGQHKFKPI